jgi:selenide, water dikinase
MGPGDLAHVLRHLPPAPGAYPDLLVGLQAADDAAVWRLDAERALVQTVDFFTPIVDDAYTYGAIAAANSLSDIYAMGGEPFLALAIAAFPDSLPQDLLAEIVRGARDKAAEAGVVIAGGHTVVDDEPKYGLCVTGLVHPERILTKGAARPGDTLYLTKPLGTGVIATALKKERAAPQHVEGAVQSMLRLNRDAARLLRQASLHPVVRAATDITGFGLLGHAYEMALASGIVLEVDAAEVPFLPGALEYVGADLLPGGADRNQAYLEEADDSGDPRLTIAPGVDPVRAAALFDPQTSGGLLFAAPQEAVAAVEGAFREAGQPLWAIGRCAAGHGVRVA